MVDENELKRLRDIVIPAPGESAKARAFEAALRAYDEENISTVSQGSVGGLRLTERARKLWSEIMQKKLIATPAIAGLVALPIAGYATFHMLREQPSTFGGDEKITETLAEKPATVKPLAKQATGDQAIDKPLATSAPGGRQEDRRGKPRRNGGLGGAEQIRIGRCWRPGAAECAGTGCAGGTCATCANGRVRPG